MFRLIIVWLFFTGLLFGVKYFIDSKTKTEAKHWGIRFATQGIVVAVILGLIIFLERL